MLRLPGVLRGRARRLLTGSAVSTVAGALVAAALLYPGVEVTDVHLDDRSVWVTNSSMLLVGRLNSEIDELTGGLRSGSADVDVVQDAGAVVVHDAGTSAVAVLDPALVALQQPVTVPSGARVALGGSTVAVSDPSSGAVWVRSVDELASLDVTTAGPDLELDRGGWAVVGEDGVAHGLSPLRAEVLSLTADGVSEWDLDLATDDPEELDLSAVGARPVVLDRAAGAVLVEGEDAVEVPGTAAALLQQPGRTAERVVLADQAALRAVPLDGGAVVTLVEAGGEGDPVRPVQVAGCAHGAWASTARYAGACAGAEPVARDIPAPGPQGPLSFRVNREVVVLNDTRTGAIWMPDEDLALVDDWASVVPPDEDEDDGQEDEQDTEDELTDREQQNRPPVAEDDDLGARPGRSTLLSVLDNDTDEDGDVLTVSVSDLQLPEGFSLSVVGRGSSLQLDVPADAEGTVDIPYVVDDGRTGTDSATARVTVRPFELNEPPVQWRRTTTVTRLAGTAQVRVLPDWRDPDGDDLVLASAAATTADTVRYTPDGAVTFVDSGTAAGRKDVVLVVGDGQEVTEGVTVVDVRPDGAAPVAESDHLVLAAGGTGTVEPLANDQDPSGEGLRLASVGTALGLTVESDLAQGTVTVTAQTAGTTYLEYVVTNGPRSSTGLIRVDVRPAATANTAPVAVRDVALLRTGRHVLVDPLANDEDADDDVLVLQSVAGAQEAGLSVAVVEHRLLRITAVGEVPGPVVLRYVVSDGAASDTGQVLVVPVPVGATQQPPLAVPDVVTVRAGDVVSVPVLDNDSHPDGDTLTLAPELVQTVPDGGGLLFASGDLLRYQAPTAPGSYYAVYSVLDSRGQSASTQVTFHVVAVDEAANRPPVPPLVVARAIAGTVVRVLVPLHGTDPDGDSVRVVGVETPPARGRVVETGAGHLVYEAFPDSAGTDELRYVVADALGARATGTVRIGVAPPAQVNSAPTAVDDVVVVRPGRRVQVPVLLNDTDADADDVRLSTTVPLQVPAGTTAVVRGDRVEVTAPQDEGSVSIGYTVEDGRGGRGTGYVTLDVRADAPLRAPIARDDQVADDALAGRTAAEIEVLVNDEDPDGDRADLLVSSEAADVRVEGNLLVVPVQARRQVVAYAVTDADGLVGRAFAVVPGSADQAPHLKADAPALEVVSGDQLTVDLLQQVGVREGRTPRVTAEGRVSATRSDGSPLVVDATTLRFVSAPDYVGPAAITVEVTDGTGPDDPQGLVAVLTLPVTVLPSGNQPPVLSGGDLQVAPGEEEAVLDLASAVTDADPGDAGRHTFRADTATLPAGLTARLEGATLAVEAAAEVPKGTRVALPVEVSDPAGASASGSVTIQVVASTRPLARATDDLVTDGAQGRTTTVDVLANDTNPFPDTPLTVVEADLDSGDAQVQADGSRVSVTPAGGFVGSVVVTYTVADATRDPDRHVQGRLEVVVRGRPGTPAAPTVLEVRDRTVVLQWAAPVPNGAPVLDYEVTADGFARTCPSTTCTLDGLTNDREYRFSVSARNEVGRSDPSPPSAVARPDQRPDRPSAPTLAFADRSLQVAWAAPRSTGSPVQSYTLEISPAGAGSPQVTVTGTSYTWTGLTNGTSYQVRVRASNRGPEPSDWSEYSRPEVPSGVPDAPAAPAAEVVPETPGTEVGGQLRVTWDAPNDNGATIDRYDLQVFRNGSQVQTIPVAGDKTEQAVSADNGEEYTFRVVAVNRAGSSPASPASSTATPFGRPDAVSTVTRTPLDRAARLDFSAPADNGKPIVRYEYQLFRSTAALPLPADRVVRGLQNGTSYDLLVRACNDYCGGWSSEFEPQVTPYGPPNTPGASAQGNSTSVTLRWSPPGTNGRSLARLEVSVDGGGWEQVAVAAGERIVGNGYSQTHSVRVRAVDTEGQVSPEGYAEARSQNPPAPTATLARDRSAVGASSGGVTCSHSSCRYLDFDVSNFPAGSYRVCAYENGASFFCQNGVQVPANGRAQTPIFYGIPGGRVRLEIVGVMFTNEVTW